MRWTAAVLLACAAAGGCVEAEPAPVEGAETVHEDGDGRATARHRMVREQIEGRGVGDARVLAAMRRVPRHAFVPPRWRWAAYDDRALSIGHEQTISQPYVVAVMTELAGLGPQAKVLEIGTGSGYQAAVLAEVAGDVYSIEIVPVLAAQAARTLRELGYDRIHLRTGDGFAGWPEAAPFDAIVVTAAPPAVPPALVDQLVPGGRLVIPVGAQDDQELQVHERTPGGVQVRAVFPVRFVPLVRDRPAH